MTLMRLITIKYFNRLTALVIIEKKTSKRDNQCELGMAKMFI